MLTEDLLHYIWKFQLFDNRDLRTKSGLPAQIIRQGIYQHNAGADFENAKVIIDNITLAGNIEIHVKEAEFRQHNHHFDKAYNSVILHVVWQSENEKTVLENGATAEILELKKRVDRNLLLRYDLLMRQQTKIACSELKSDVDEFRLAHFLQKVGVERLERKVNDINRLLVQFGNDFDQVVFILLARYLGGNVNNEPMQRLATSIPIKILYKNLSQPHIVEAIVFGQAGLLQHELNGDYAKELLKEYNYQKRLHRLLPLEKTVWKFAKVRPSNFPAVRVAQLAALVNSGNFQLESLMKIRDLKAFEKLFLIGEDTNQTGKRTIESLAINFLIPLLFSYGKYSGNERLCDKAITILETVPVEKNTLISQFGFLIKPVNASETQALLELKTNYCAKLKCLDCAVGNALLRP